MSTQCEWCGKDVVGVICGEIDTIRTFCNDDCLYEWALDRLSELNDLAKGA